MLTATLEAARARAQAQGIPTPWLGNPSIDARREQANGPAGASTEAIGATLVLDLGFAGTAERRAAALREGAGDAWLQAEATGGICAVRDLALELWVEGERAARIGRAHARLSSVLTSLDGLAGAGEAAAYDRDRLGLTVLTHGVERDAQARGLAVARARASAWTGGAVAGVELVALPPPASLDGLLAEALQSDPVLTALREERKAAELALSAARRAALPDLSLSGGARWDALPDGTERTPGYELGLSVELPLLDHNQVAIAEERAGLADLDARIARREAELRASVEAAWRQVEALGPVAKPLAAEAVWDGALARYAAGEASIDELLSVAGDVEQAELAGAEAVAMRRRARLELSCAVGAFPEPEIQALLEESLR